MRKILFVLALLCSTPAWATSTVTYNTPHCTPTAGTSCTLSATPAFGDLLVSFAYRATSATAPSTPLPWSVIKSVTGSVNSLKIAYKYSLGNETTCGTWANASATDCHDYGGLWIGSAGPVGATTSGTTGSSTTVSYPGFTMNDTSGNSWVGCASGADAVTNDVPPTGITLRSGTTLTNIMFGDTNGGVASWSTQTHTITSAPWASACWQMTSAPALTAIYPGYLVDRVFPEETGEALTTPFTYTINVQSSGGTLANNLLNFWLAWGYTSVAPTVSNIYCNSDTGHATWTWTQAPGGDGFPVLDAGYNLYATDYYIPGATSGCQTISVVFSSAPNNVVSDFSEFRQIATSSPLDTAVAAVCSACSPNVSAGSITTGTSGDLVYEACAQNPVAGYGTSTGMFTGSGSTVLVADYNFAIGAQAMIQTTAGAINPYFNWLAWTAGADAACTTLAFKTSGAAGTANSGQQIISAVTSTQPTATTATLEGVLLNTGDTWAIGGNAGSIATNPQCTAISDTLGSTYTVKNGTGANAGSPAWYFDSNSKSGLDYVKMTGCPTSGTQSWIMYEVSGSLNSTHTASFDATMGICPFVSTVNGPPYTGPVSCTPAQNELVLGQMIEGQGPQTGMSSPACATYAYPVYSGMTDASFTTEGGGYSYCYASGTTTQNYTWTGDSNSSFFSGSVFGIIPQTSAVVRHRAWVTQ